jgi:hypothetical protein
MSGDLPDLEHDLIHIEAEDATISNQQASIHDHIAHI